MKVTTSPKSGFTLVEIMITVTIIGLLAAIAIPNFVRSRNTTQKKGCINNLRQIDGAKHQWALEYRKGDGATPVPDELGAYILRGRFPTCPIIGQYTIGSMTNCPICSKAAAGHVLP